MSTLPPDRTPLNRHSLIALESWLDELGAQQSNSAPCLWIWLMPNWSAELKMEQDELRVTWEQKGQQSCCCFSYGLHRGDVDVAITQGP